MNNPENIVQAKHLEAALTAAKNYTDNKVATVQGGSGGDFDIESFTITSASWTEDTLETSGYTYVANISASGVTANDYAEILFSRAGLSVVEDAELSPTGETTADAIKLYAKAVPSADITGQYFIFKGGV